MANQTVRPKTRREFLSTLSEPYDPKAMNLNEVFSEPAKLGQPEINRAKEVSLKNDNVRDYKIGIQDFDEAMMYYFTNVLKPSVIQNNTRINVPVIYGDPENWKTIQSDGYYRDANGRLMAPLIMFKRRSLTQNRNLGFKLDGNAVKNIQLFEKKYSRRNVYSNFNMINNRSKEVEYVASITPDYVTVEYDCVVWTYFVEQMDPLIESINFASRTYWGDPSKFQFHASIETFEESITYEIGEDRAVRNSFSVTLNGYIIPDSVNKSLASANRVYGVSQVVFGLETDTSLDANKQSRERNPNIKPYGATVAQDGNNVVVNQYNYVSSLDQAQAQYIMNNTQTQGTYVNTTTCTFPKGWAVAPSPIPPNAASNFNFFINGMYVEPVAVVSFTDNTTYSTLVLDTQMLGYSLESSDVIIAIGKFN